MIGFGNINEPQSFDNKILALGDYSQAPFFIHYGANYIWTINGATYTNATVQNFDISPTADTSLKRIDITFLDYANNIKIIS
jgi:hypothetical protein